MANTRMKQAEVTARHRTRNYQENMVIKPPFGTAQPGIAID